MLNSNKVTKTTKVLQVVWRFNTGGAERMVVNFHNYFTSRSDIKIRTLSFTPSKGELWEKELVSSGVAYIPKVWYDKFPRPLSSLFRRFLYKKHREQWFLAQIENFNPDVIHIHLANMGSALYEVCRTLPKSIRIYYHMHSMPEAVPDRFKSNIIKAFADYTYRPICVTKLQLESAKKIYGISGANIVYNGIDETRFTNLSISESEKEQLKKSLNIPCDSFVIGTVGRGAPVKNFPFLAKIAAEYSKRRKTTLLMVGNIPLQLKEDIQKESGDANVVYAGTRSDTNRFYRIFNIFVLTSFYESSSIVTVEAQLSGTPCVISNTISDEVIISDGVKRVSLNDDVATWVDAIDIMAPQKVNLTNEKLFDFGHSVCSLLNIYKDVKV